MGSSLLLFSFILGNPLLLVSSSVALGALLVSLLVRNPTVEEVRTIVPERRSYVGDLLDVEVRYAFLKGEGVLEIEQPLSPSFEVVEGSNAHLLVVEEGGGRGSFLFKVRPHSPGSHTLPPIEVRTIHSVGVLSSTTFTLGSPTPLPVYPRIPRVRRVRLPSVRASPLPPSLERSPWGVPSSEFKEVREFQSGDTLRSINWKATARRWGSSPWGSSLFVNEREREGRTRALLLLDAGSSMRVGSEVLDALEASKIAASSLSSFLLERGYRVGFHVFNTPWNLTLYPDTGRRQLLRIRRILALRPPPDTKGGGIQRALEELSGEVEQSPLVILFTRPSFLHPEELKALGRLSGSRRFREIRAPLLVVAPSAPALVPIRSSFEAPLLPLFQRNERWSYRYLRRMGATVVEWNPLQESFPAVLAREVLARGVVR